MCRYSADSTDASSTPSRCDSLVTDVLDTAIEQLQRSTCSCSVSPSVPVRPSPVSDRPGNPTYSPPPPLSPSSTSNSPSSPLSGADADDVESGGVREVVVRHRRRLTHGHRRRQRHRQQQAVVAAGRERDGRRHRRHLTEGGSSSGGGGGKGRRTDVSSELETIDRRRAISLGKEDSFSRPDDCGPSPPTGNNAAGKKFDISFRTAQYGKTKFCGRPINLQQ